MSQGNDIVRTIFLHATFTVKNGKITERHGFKTNEFECTCIICNSGSKAVKCLSL